MSVGVGRVAGREQQPPGEHDRGDRGARLGVRLVGRQLVRIAERLVAVAAPETAGQVGARLDHVVPAPEDRVEQLPIAELGRDVDGAAVEIQLADGVAGHGRGVADGSVVLPVRRTRTARCPSRPWPRRSIIRAASSR